MSMNFPRDKATRSGELGEKRAKKKMLELLAFLEKDNELLDALTFFHEKSCRAPYVVSRNTKFFYYYMAFQLGHVLINLVDRINSTTLDDIDRDFIMSVLKTADIKHRY